ncbi:MAG: ABC transporter ATP-binding protein [Bacteroidales bacterium]|nr:ABC transporter ATP-binding protein [Bacteroidales bacterium]
MSTAIEFNNISKQYRLGLVSTRTLSHDLDRWWKVNVMHKEDPYLKIGSVNDRSQAADSEYVWALKDIDFKVEQGDVVGIIGKNGAGKSTLLKLLSKVTGPTTGTIRARGRIGSLLEVGTGFHPEMTGRENIFMNGAILGMTKQEIARKLDEIVDFSGCERYLDTPVKRYSSGMMVRLGFAVAAHLDPEILVVDEVLAVGDAEFQKKAIGKMQDVSKGEGRTVLFVSHNMASVKALCKTGILLENGMIKYIDTVDKVVQQYQMANYGVSSIAIGDRLDRKGNGKLRLQNLCFLNTNNEIVDRVSIGDSFKIRLDLKNNSWGKDDTIQELSLGINDEFGQRIIVMNNEFLGKNIKVSSQDSNSIVEFVIEKCPLAIGSYTMAFFLSDKLNNIIDWIDNIATLYVEEGDYYGTGKVQKKGLGRFVIDYDIQ